MENLFDFEGCSVDYGVFATSTDLKDELITSLTSFALLHSQHRDRLQKTSESFTLTAALYEMHEDVAENEAARVMSTVFGGVLGAACGGVCGGVWGTLGAVSAVTCARFCDNINAVGATVGFVGSVMGGAVGGASCGAVGAAVGAAAEVTGNPLHAVSDVVWFSIGFATGGAIGGVFGGTVGAAGGAVGGAFGALSGTIFAVGLVRRIVGHFCECKDSIQQKKKSKKVNVIQKTGEDFRAAIKPLVEELKTIKSISDKMASSHLLHSVAAQTMKTLASVTAMEKTISDSQRATDLPQFVSSGEEAARQSKKLTEELETTRAEVEKLLVSLRKH